MKRLFTPGIAFVVFLTALVAVPQQQAHGQGPGLVSSVMSRLQKNHATLKSLRASINMEKYDAKLRDKDFFAGTVLYMPAAGKNALIRLEWKTPQHETLGVADGKYVLYRERINTVYIGSAAKKQNESDVIGMLSMSSTELQNRFQPFQDVREESVGGVSATHLKLIPIKPTSFSYAEVWVDSSGMPIKTKMVEKNGDATTVTLSNLDKKPLSRKEFAVGYPSNATIIKG